MKTHSLSVYLIKEGLNQSYKIIRPDLTIQRIPLNMEPDRGYELAIRRTLPKLPEWAPFFSGHVDLSVFGDNRSTAAVLLVPVEGRIVALAFGQAGRHMLVDDCWEERFGLRVVLNSVEEGRLRSIDKQTFDAIPKHGREQTSRDASSFDFTLDIERDLVRAVTGALDDESMGRMLTGMDALRTRIRTSLDAIEEPLARYVRRSQDDTYKKSFPWVDHLSDVKSKETIEILDMYLIDRLLSRDSERCWLAAPDLIDWSFVRGFRYSQSPSSPEHHDIHLESLLEELCESVDLKTLDRKRVFCIGDDDQIKDSWPVYKCLYCEIDHGDESYLLSGGKWYQVSREFVQDVNRSFERVERIILNLPEYGDDSEARYLERVCQDNSNNFALMDRKIITHGAVGSKIEFCDIFTSNRDLIHVKRYGNASVLSHLFSQWLVSGELLLVDSGFREKVRAKLPVPYRDLVPVDRPATPDFRIVFAIISQSLKPLSLPFFSRLSLRHAVRRLEGFGFKVALAKIDVGELHRKRKKYGERKRSNRGR